MTSSVDRTSFRNNSVSHTNRLSKLNLHFDHKIEGSPCMYMTLGTQGVNSVLFITDKFL